jgi:preprotein translocase subunit SecD
LSSRRNYLLLIGLLIAALVGVALLAVPSSPFHKSLRKGLDLQGGLEVVLQAQPPRGHTLTADDLNRSVDIMRNRVDKLGVSEPEIRKQGSNQIVIQLPAVHDVNQAASIIGQTAQLELYDLETSLVPPSVDASQNPVATTSLYDLLTRVQSGQKGLPTQYWLFNSRTKRLVAGPTETLGQLKAIPQVKALRPLKPLPAKTAKGKKAVATNSKLTTTPGFPTGYQLMTTPNNTVVITCDSVSSVVCPGLSSYPVPGATYYYLFKHDLTADPPSPAMTGTELALKGTQQDFDPSTGAPIVTLQFTGKGNKDFHRITRDEAIRGQALRQAQHFAIVLDNQIRSFPQIDYNQYPDGIDPTGYWL